MTIDTASLEQLLAESIGRHRVPGASVAFLAGDEVTAAAAGVLNRATGVEATPDALFQVGSITKVWTTSLLAQLVAEGAVDFDTPVVEVLPEFKVADPDVSRHVTIRHLVTHTSGIEGDVFADYGRGDDCVALYVAGMADLAQIHPLGATMSYCNSGFVVAGRIVEVLTGQTWDVALRERLIEPLGLTHTVTLPEEAIRCRAAMGHIGEAGAEPQPAPVWGLPRAIGPAGLIAAQAADVVEFARLHLHAGRTEQGEQLLRPDLVAEMQRAQVDVPVPESHRDHWGLGWFLSHWEGGSIYGHDGGTIGQAAFLRVDPVHEVAVVLLTNGGGAGSVYTDVVEELFAELAGIRPRSFAPPAVRPEVDGRPHAGVYQHHSTRVTITATGDGLSGVQESIGELADYHDAVELELKPVRSDLWATRPLADPDAPWTALRFYELDDGAAYMHIGGRATPKVG